MSKRVLIAQIMHETNTFSLLPTDEDSYRRRYLGIGDEIVGQFRGTRTELGGFIDAAERFGWTTVNAVAANATPSGKVTAACWTLLKGAVLDALDKQGPVDGICLALHGAMVTETEDDAEGALLEALRRRLGPRVPIAVTLDLHANVSDAMAENANAIIAYRTYPHIDQFERAAQAADLVNEMMEGRLELSCIVARPPSLDGCDHGRTSAGVGPMVDLLARAAEYEKETGIHAISIHAGFQWSDIHMAGPSVSISHNPAVTRRAKDILDMLVREIWDTRDKQTVHYQTLEVAVAEALKGEDGTGKPLVIADPTDNPGGGGYGDTTNLLRALLEAGVKNACFCPITDPAAVQAGQKAGVGATISVDLGGHTDPAFGAPIKCTGVVKHLGDGRFVHDGPMWKGVVMQMGPTMVLDVDGIEIVVTSNRQQTTDHQAFLTNGIDPLKKSVIVVKSAHHFRAAFEPISRKVIAVDSGSLCSHDWSRFDFKKLRRPIWPLEEVVF